jgi:hypothetical protein
MNYNPHILPNYDMAQTERLIILSLAEVVTCKSTESTSLAFLTFLNMTQKIQGN